MFTALKRVLRTGFINFIRNAYVSFASIFVLTITLLVIGGALIFNQLLVATLETVKDKVDVNVYFVTEAVEDDVFAFKRSLEGLPEVKEVTYTSPEDALASFKEKHANEPDVLASLDELGENPLGATLSIRAYDPGQYGGIVQYINSAAATDDEEPLIDTVNYNQNKHAIETLTVIIDKIEVVSWWVSVILIIVAVLITLNTIRLAIYTAREEITVMRLVGAGNTFIRGPFVAQGMLYGLFAGIVTLLILYPVTYYLGAATEAFFGLNIFSYYINEFGRLFVIIVGSGVGFGVLSSLIAISRYLRV